MALAFTSAFASIVSTYASTQTIDRTIAIANNDIILESQLNAAIMQFKNSKEAKSMVIPNDHELKTIILNQLINKSLMLQIAKKNSFTVPESDIDKAIEGVAQKQNTTVSNVIAQFKEKGISEAEIRQQIADDILITQVKQSQIRGRISISDQEVEQLATILKDESQNMLSYHLGEISINLPFNATPAEVDTVSRRMKSAIKELESGVPFSKVAQKYSDSSSAINGGDIGELTLSDVPRNMYMSLSKSHTGDLVGPIREDHGLTLYKVFSTKKFEPTPVEQVKLKHILILTSIIFDDEKAKATLQKYRNEIINGDSDFSDIARLYSQDPGSAYKGGDLDWINPEIFDPKFKEEVSKLQPMEISQPFKSGFGWHIVLLEGRKIDKDSVEAFKIQAREILFRRSMMEESTRWEHELRDNSYVKIFLD